MSKVFAKPSSIVRRVLLIVVLAIGMMGIHSYTNWLQPIERFSDKALVPLHWLANIPSQLNAWGELILSDRSDLESENTRLNQENLIHRGQLQRMAELAA